MRWKCACSYDGSGLFGWQTQDGQLSVQQVIEEALESVFKEKVSIQGSGRTDAGVHAIEQIFHFDYDWRHGGERLVKALYSKLPKTIRVESAMEVDEEFHSRFSALSKRYHYRLFLGQADPFRWPYCWSVPERLNLNRVAKGMKQLLGEHDFAAFAANRGLEYESTVRTMTRSCLSQDRDYIYLRFEADGFMYKMVRSLAGCLVNLGLGRVEISEIETLLDSGQRTPVVQAAPARGLFLEKVIY